MPVVLGSIMDYNQQLTHNKLWYKGAMHKYKHFDWVYVIMFGTCITASALSNGLSDGLLQSIYHMWEPAEQT